MRASRAVCVMTALLALPMLGLTSGCPGTLANKDRFFIDGMFVSGDLTILEPADLSVVMPGPSDGGASDGGDGGGGDGGRDGGGRSDGGPDLSVPPDPCGDVPTRVFLANCGGGGCHAASKPQNGLDLVSPGLAQRVVGKAAQGCGAILADPKNPGGSLLYTKLIPMPPCGSMMPLGRPPLSNFDIACVKAWIAAQ